ATTAFPGSSSSSGASMQYQRVLHQPFETPQEVVDLLFGRLALDQLLDAAAELLGEVAAEVDLLAAQLVHDLEAADIAVQVVELDDAVVRTVVDHVHPAPHPVLGK